MSGSCLARGERRLQKRKLFVSLSRLILGGSCMAAQSNVSMDGERQYFTFRQTRRTVPMTFR